MWQTVTEGMAAVTTSGTAAPAHLEGIDFAGKTGTAQVMSHDALARSSKGKHTEPNSWFVGIAPRRNPDIVVAVLWENGNWGKNAAALASQVIRTFVEKQRKQAGNLLQARTVVDSAGNPAGEPAGVGTGVPFAPANTEEKKAPVRPTATAGETMAVKPVRYARPARLAAEESAAAAE